MSAESFCCLPCGPIPPAGRLFAGRQPKRPPTRAGLAEDQRVS
jgi:hypothetical protein